MLIGFVGFLIWPIIVRWMRYAFSCILFWTMTSHDLNPSLRNCFKDIPIPKVRPSDHHSHPLQAAYRDSASRFAVDVAERMGLVPYFVQMSNSDVRRNRMGSRSFYWHKDTTVRPRDFKPPSDALLVIVDTDFYIDLPIFLSEVRCPVLIYTVLPEVVAYRDEETSFCFDSHNRIKYRVAGAYYHHELWNHSQDVVTCTNFDQHGLNALRSWFMPHTVVYNVERRKVCNNHSLVLYTPMSSWHNIFAVMSNLMLEHNLMSRLRVNHGQFNLMDVFNDTGHHRSVGRVGEYVCATLPVDVFDTTRVQARLAKHLTPASLQRFVDDEDPVRAAVLCDWFRENIDADPMLVAFNTFEHYQFVPDKVYEDDAKPAQMSFMQPLLYGAYVPDVCRNNDQHMIDSRVTKTRCSLSTCAPFVRRMASEFMTYILSVTDDVNSERRPNLHPSSIDEVFDKQNRPNQRTHLDAGAINTKYHRVISSFMKKESYQKIADPRNISTINAKDKLWYSTVIYSFAKHLKKFPWYAFGNTPRVIAERVAEICSNCENFVVATDFSRMDGHISPLWREFEQMIIVNCFAPQYRPQIIELMRSQHGLKGYSAFGIRYDQCSSRASGSPETSASNTLCNAFVCYLAWRMSKRVDGTYYSHQDAIRRLGIFGGDDGLTADLSEEVARKAARHIGQVLTFDVVPRNGQGVSFLSRQFGPEVFAGDPTSCCDIMRQMCKFHLTTHLSSITEDQKLVSKAFALYLTDSNTPFVGEFVAKVLELSDDWSISVGMERDVTWWSHYDLTDQFPNSSELWMIDLLTKQGIDYDSFLAWVGGADSLAYLLQVPHPFNNPPEPQEPDEAFVENGVMYPGKNKREGRRKKKKAAQKGK
jgi:hypothetical protein